MFIGNRKGPVRAALFVFALASFAEAQSFVRPRAPDASGRIEERSYSFAEAGKDMPYSIFVPASYAKGKPAPLLVALHGWGSTPAQIIRYRGLTDLAEEHGYIVVAPMGYNEKGWYGALGPGKNRFSERLGRGTPGPDNLGALSELDVLNVIERTQQDFDVDPRRIYLFGHSMGGGGAIHFAMKYPGRWAGVAVVAPALYGDPQRLTEAGSVPFIVVQGTADRLVDVRVTRRWVEQMKIQDSPHRYIEVDGGNHITVAMTHLSDIFNFFDRNR